MKEDSEEVKVKVKIGTIEEKWFWHCDIDLVKSAGLAGQVLYPEHNLKTFVDQVCLWKPDERFWIVSLAGGIDYSIHKVVNGNHLSSEHASEEDGN